MERIELAGAWEGDALPGGRFCAAYPDGRVATHAGVWQAPEWLRYPRLHPVSDEVTGTRQSGLAAVISLDGPDDWREVAAQSCGLSAVIYDAAGTLLINSDCAAPYYSLGFRYVADRVYSGAETYADAAREIYEYTTLDGITIGQGPSSGVHILYNGRRYLLEPGTTTVVRFAKSGDKCAVGTFRQDRGFIAHWFTVAEIATLPEILPPDPPDPPDPEEPMNAPVVSVQRWTLDELLDGREFVFTDAANPGLGYQVRVHVANGSMYAEMTNAAGHASTGQARPVKPCDDDGNHEPPPTPTPTKTPIETDHGTFWTVDRSDRVQHGDVPDLFEFAPAGSKVSIKAPNGRYVCAEGGGGDVLIANRDAVGGWESFGKSPSGPGFSLQADNGMYVSAELDGRMSVNRTSVGGWETFRAKTSGGGGGGALPRLVVRDRIYFGQEDGTRFHAIQCSDFSLYKRFLDGDDIGEILAQRAEVGFNMVRVWLLNTSVIPGGLEPDEYLHFYDNLPEFLRVCAGYGLYVELTAFTQTQTLMPDNGDQVAHFYDTCNAIRDAPNVLLELVNEADQHDNATSAHFARPEGIVASSGSNGADSAPPLPDWDYCLYHTNDLSEWQRKCPHNAMEWGDVRGIPCMSNENTRAIDRDGDLDHFYDAAAGSALLNAGACFHSQAGKISELWGGHELECARSWVAGAKSVPLEYQPGNYQRHDEMNGPDCIRAYSRTLPDGRSWLVKIRP
jgi:hypothetical protein